MSTLGRIVLLVFLVSGILVYGLLQAGFISEWWNLYTLPWAFLTGCAYSVFVREMR